MNTRHKNHISLCTSIAIFIILILHDQNNTFNNQTVRHWWWYSIFHLQWKWRQSILNTLYVIWYVVMAMLLYQSWPAEQWKPTNHLFLLVIVVRENYTSSVVNSPSPTTYKNLSYDGRVFSRNTLENMYGHFHSGLILMLFGPARSRDIEGRVRKVIRHQPSLNWLIFTSYWTGYVSQYSQSLSLPVCVHPLRCIFVDIGCVPASPERKWRYWHRYCCWGILSSFW